MMGAVRAAYPGIDNDPAAKGAIALALMDLSLTVSLEELIRQREHAQQTLDKLQSDASAATKQVAIENFWQINIIPMPEPEKRAMSFDRAMLVVGAVIALLGIWIQLHESSMSDEDAQRVVKQAIEQVQRQQSPPDAEPLE